MVTNKKLKRDLLNELKVTPQRLSQKTKKIKKEYGPMSTPDAIYVIAHLEGFDLTKYLDDHIVDKIRTILAKTKEKHKPTMSQKSKSKNKSRNKTIIELKVDSKLINNFNSLLSITQAENAKKMAGVYPKYYIIENSIRILIKRILSSKYGKNWWNKCVSTRIKNKVNDRKKSESKQPWHGKRGHHEIFYSNFGDLDNIIISNWEDFKNIFDSQEWISIKLKELEHPRNILAHHNPVSSTDLKRIEIFLHDWIELLKYKSDKIPKN